MKKSTLLMLSITLTTTAFAGPFPAGSNLADLLKGTKLNKISSPSSTKITNTVNFRATFPKEAAIVDRFVSLAEQANYTPPKPVNIERIRADIDNHQAKIDRAQILLTEAQKQKQSALQEYEAKVRSGLKPALEQKLQDLLKLLQNKSISTMTAPEQTLYSPILVGIAGMGNSLNMVKDKHNAVEAQQEIISYYGNEIGKLKGRISGVTSAAAQATDPSNQLVSKIEKLLKAAFGPGVDVKDLKTQFAIKVKKGQESEALFTLVQGDVEKLEDYLEEQEVNVSFTPRTGVSVSAADVARIADLTQQIANLKQMVSDLQGSADKAKAQNVSLVAKLELEAKEAKRKLVNSALRGEFAKRSLAESNASLRAQLLQQSSSKATSDASVSSFNKEFNFEHMRLNGEDVVKIIDRSTRQEILVSINAIDALSAQGIVIDQDLIKDLFRRKQISIALDTVQNGNSDIQAQVEFLKKAGVRFSDEVIGNSDSVVAGLSDDDKTLLLLQSMKGISKDAKTQGNTNGAELLAESMVVVGDVIGRRMETMDRSLSGVAAGDESYFNINNVWATGFYGVSKQKSYAQVSGYKGKTTGGSIGVDFQLNNDVLVGAAYSRVNSNFTGDKKGKTLAASNVFSLYSKVDLTNKVNLSIQGSCNTTKVTHSYQKLTGVNRYQATTGKFNTNGFNTRATVSYLLVNNNNLVVTPYVGFSYGAQYDGSYTETGSGVHNMFVSAKNTNELVAIAGAKVSKVFLVGNTTFIPSVTTSVENVVNAKNHKLKARYSWANKSATQVTDLGKSKNAYNLGLGLTAKHNNIEVSTEYNYRLKKKYNSHQGSVKFKLLF